MVNVVLREREIPSDENYVYPNACITSSSVAIKRRVGLASKMMPAKLSFEIRQETILVGFKDGL